MLTGMMTLQYKPPVNPRPVTVPVAHYATCPPAWVEPNGTGILRRWVKRSRRQPRTSPRLEAQIATLHAVSELLRAQLTDTRQECDRLRQKAERLALPPPAPLVPLPPRRRRRRWWQPAW